MQVVKEYRPFNPDKVIAYDVMTADYEMVARIGRFEDKEDAEKFRDAYNDDLRRGLTVLRLRGDVDMSIERERELLRSNSAYVSPVHDIPVIAKGHTLSPHKFDADYGWYYNQATDASEE